MDVVQDTWAKMPLLSPQRQAWEHRTALEELMGIIHAYEGGAHFYREHREWKERWAHLNLKGGI